MARTSARTTHRDSLARVRPDDAAAKLTRLTRAELIRVICRLESQLAHNDPERCTGEASLGHGPTLLVRGSVRSGQTVTFPQGDIVVLGSLGSGAEIAAGGSIHIYGALRGRAYAGTAGGTDARIFCQKLEAELVAVAGLSRMAEDLDSNLHGRPAYAWRDANRIELGGLSTTPEDTPTLSDAGARPAPTSAPPAPWLTWARRLIRRGAHGLAGAPVSAGT
jgi:septum site-determining protein MinC